MVHTLWQKLSPKERAVLARVLVEGLFITFVCVASGDLAGTACMLVFSGGPLSLWLWPGLVLHFRAQVARDRQQALPPIHWAGGPNLPR